MLYLLGYPLFSFLACPFHRRRRRCRVVPLQRRGPVVPPASQLHLQLTHRDTLRVDHDAPDIVEVFELEGQFAVASPDVQHHASTQPLQPEGVKHEPSQEPALTPLPHPPSALRSPLRVALLIGAFDGFVGWIVCVHPVSVGRVKEAAPLGVQARPRSRPVSTHGRRRGLPEGGVGGRHAPSLRARVVRSSSTFTFWCRFLTNFF